MTPKKRIRLQVLLAIIFTFSAFSGVNAQNNKFNYDYSKALVMKLDLAIPDGHGGSKIFCDFKTALEWIKQADQLTLQVPKIIYLVGWQYKGHDDKYPAMFEVNNDLKRVEDVSGQESLQWLIREARKYHTTVSLHINMTDAYDDSPLWKTYIKNDLISKREDGNLMVIGSYNNRNAYQINYRNEWESGWTQKRIDSLMKLLPELKEAGTIHIDAWIARESKGHYESLVTESEYQKKALKYWKKKGIDVTSEWVMDYMTGLVPFAWHFNARTQKDYLNYPASVYTGSGINPDVKSSDFGLGFLFGESMYGEGLWPYFHKTEAEKRNWDKEFTQKFYLNCLQYFFLNNLERKSITGIENERKALFSQGITVSLKDRKVCKGDVCFRKENTVLFPVVWKEEPTLAAYSDVAIQSQSFKLKGEWEYFVELAIFEVGIDGLKQVGKTRIRNNEIQLTLKAGQPYVLKPIKKK